MSNSQLASIVKLAPSTNHYGSRRHEIDTVTIHCYVGQVTAERAAQGFSDPNKRASCNYAIGYDGKIALIVEESNASACSSNEANDRRAVTIEVASDSTPPYAVTESAYHALIALLADICRRNGIQKLRWEADPNLIGQPDRQNMTVHRWFANKACPGDWLYRRHGSIAVAVNASLKEEPQMTEKEVRAIVRDELLQAEKERREAPASEWARPYIQYAVDSGLMVEIENGCIDRPQDFVTRQELATVAFAVCLKNSD